MNDQQARQTPIIDLLRDIPADARMVYEVTPTHHQSIPVGVLAKNAADEIERLRQWELVGREWIDKTDWMQSRDAPVRWLGKHRADALRDEIERLTAENLHLRQSATVSVSSTLHDAALAELNGEIEQLRAALRTCVWALRQPIDDWKGVCERRALDEAARVLHTRGEESGNE